MLTRNLRLLLPILTLAALTSTTVAQTAPTTVNFSTQIYNSGPGAAAVVSGDFNEDGKPDLATVNNAANSVQILLNNGDGTFRLGSQIATGMNPVAIVAGNFNNDNHLDLAVANGDRTITFAAGLGDGTFPTPSSFPTSGIPAAMTGANLLNNGLTQLATVECATQQTSPCSLNLYQTDGHLLPSHAQSIALPVPAHSNVFPNLVVSDDFNLDNKPDIAVATDTKVLVFNNVAAFNGTGAAKVALHTTITPPNTSRIDGLTAGHFNTGAAPDLAISVFQNVNDTNFPQSVYSYLNTGSGSFFLKQTVGGATRNFGQALTSGDVNGDGIEDLILEGISIKSGPTAYALGRGDGTFTAPQAAFNDETDGLVVRDLNLNSRHDLAIASSNSLGGTSDTAVLLNQNALTNCPPPSSAVLGAKICAATPSTNALTVRASGNSPEGIRRLELWVDGHKLAQAFSDQLHTKVGVAAGTHSVAIVAVDSNDSRLAKTTVSVKVP